MIDNGDGVNGTADVVVYTITVNNTGDTSLTGVTISDVLTDGNGTALSLDAGPTFGSASSGVITRYFSSGEIATYTATYTIAQNPANTVSSVILLRVQHLPQVRVIMLQTPQTMVMIVTAIQLATRRL